MTDLMSILNDSPIQIASLFSTSAVKSTIKSVDCRVPASRLITVAIIVVDGVNTERVGEAGRDDTRVL